MGCEFCEKNLRNECVCWWEVEDPRWRQGAQEGEIICQ